MWYRRKNLKDNPVSYPICISLNLFSIAAFPKSLMVDAVFKSLIDVSYSIDSEILEKEYSLTIFFDNFYNFLSLDISSFTCELCRRFSVRRNLTQLEMRKT